MAPVWLLGAQGKGPHLASLLPPPQPFGCLPILLSWYPSPSFSLMKNTKEKCASAQVWGAPTRRMEK